MDLVFIDHTECATVEVGIFFYEGYNGRGWKDVFLRVRLWAGGKDWHEKAPLRIIEIGDRGLTPYLTFFAFDTTLQCAQDGGTIGWVPDWQTAIVDVVLFELLYCSFECILLIQLD